MSILSIDYSKCTACNICIQTCPVSLISRNDENKPYVKNEKEKACIYCGHCESVCPEEALIHELSAKALKPQMPDGATINPEILGKYFRNRRSIRNFRQEKVDRKVFEDVFDIVRYAPTGTNRQMNQWIVVYEKDMVNKLADATIEWMKKASERNPAMAFGYNFPGIVSSYERGHDRICRNAPHLVIGYSLAAYGLGAKDATIATSHLELLLPSYGLGACWAGFLMMAFQFMPEVKSLIGLTDKHTVHSALMTGYPKFNYYKIPDRNKPDIRWI